MPIYIPPGERWIVIDTDRQLYHDQLKRLEDTVEPIQPTPTKPLDPPTVSQHHKADPA